ncbi:MAG TPA: diguanylate cyclase [Polyangiaceae bacterium]|nr:diguanylate cyclase [Polyangiaceae bacterium]
MKILLADDEPIARTMLAHWLTGWGYVVTAVKDGEAALEALKADPEIRLAVIDWVMPKLDGIGVCRALRSTPSEAYAYLVLLTARDNKADIIQGLDAGADDYLIKPCNPLELKVRLRAGRRVVELQDQLVAARESLRYEAMHDALTGLLNRRAILEQLEREQQRCVRHAASVAVLMVDLDHFKGVNDTYGHGAGDAVLREATQRMKACVRAYDCIGRVGGEEFLCVLPECTAATALRVAERLGTSMQQTLIAVGGGEIPVSVSVGVACSEQLPGVTSEQLIRAADVALQRAKRAGGARASVATAQELAAAGAGDPTLRALVSTP